MPRFTAYFVITVLLAVVCGEGVKSKEEEFWESMTPQERLEYVKDEIKDDYQAYVNDPEAYKILQHSRSMKAQKAMREIQMKKYPPSSIYRWVYV